IRASSSSRSIPARTSSRSTRLSRRWRSIRSISTLGSIRSTTFWTSIRSSSRSRSTYSRITSGSTSSTTRPVATPATRPMMPLPGALIGRPPSWLARGARHADRVLVAGVWWLARHRRLADSHQDLQGREEHDHHHDRPEQPRLRRVVSPEQGDDSDEADHDPEPHRVGHDPAPGLRDRAVGRRSTHGLETAADRGAGGGAQLGGSREPTHEGQDHPEPEHHVLPSLQVREQLVVEDGARGPEHGARQLVDEELSPDREDQREEQG